MDKMTNEEAIAIIRKEYLCVDRDCDIERSCGKCDLAMPSKEPILQAYKKAIEALEKEEKQMNEVTMKLTLDELTTINFALIMVAVNEDLDNKERSEAKELMKYIKDQMQKARKRGQE